MNTLRSFLSYLKERTFFRYFLRLSAFLKEKALSAHAGQSAFFFMLSFFPFLLFFFSILRHTPFSEKMFLTLVLQFIPDSFGDFMKNIITDIYASSTTSVISLTAVSALWLGSKAFLSIVHGLNAVYDQEESRNYFVLRIFAFVDSVVFALLLLLILAILVFGNWIATHVLNQVHLFPKILSSIIHMPIIMGISALFVFFLVLYKLLPNTHIKFRYHVPGALIASLGWTLFSYLYGYYIDHFSNYSSFYGTTTTIALLMVWLYACMYILFVGGMVNGFLYKNSYLYTFLLPGKKEK